MPPISHSVHRENGTLINSGYVGSDVGSKEVEAKEEATPMSFVIENGTEEGQVSTWVFRNDVRECLCHGCAL